MTDTHEADYLVEKSAAVQQFWAEFCHHAQLVSATPYQAWHFGDSRELADELVALVVDGPKRATASLGWTVDRYPALAPILGSYSVITTFAGEPRGVICSSRIERCAFRDVSAEFAWTEGEGDRSLADWRAGHWAYFTRECAVLGLTPSEDMPVVLERFELLYPKRPGA
jgi:uncharacterized protein YhfF